MKIPVYLIVMWILAPIALVGDYVRSNSLEWLTNLTLFALALQIVLLLLWSWDIDKAAYKFLAACPIRRGALVSSSFMSTWVLAALGHTFMAVMLLLSLLAFVGNFSSAEKKFNSATKSAESEEENQN